MAWTPQPGPQTWFLQCPADEIFFGGARGGGKTSGVLGHWSAHAQRNGNFARGILFRKTYDELEEVQEQASELYPKLGAKYHSSKRLWQFTNGARLKLRYMENDRDASHYQGHSYSWQGWEEITNWSASTGIDQMKGTLRTKHNIQCQWVATGNPGGVGHNWVKARFITPMRPLSISIDPVTGASRTYIPSRLSDNRILTTNDPKYADRLKGTGPEWLVKAWLEGNWDIVAGGMFDDLWDAAVHIIKPFRIPKTWPVERAFDWGSSKPFSLGWWAISNGETVEDGRRWYPGTKIRIGEWYGWNGTPNVGLHLVDTEIARRGMEMEQAMMKAGGGYTISEGPADPSIFQVTNGVCIAAAMSAVGLHFLPAMAGPGSRINGWESMRRLLKETKKPIMEEPGLAVFNTCSQFIRTVPMLPRDKRKIDDVDTNAEDHIGDETRYELSHIRRTITAQKLSGV